MSLAAKSRSRQNAGRLAQAVGDAWEEELGYQLLSLRNLERGAVHKTGPEARVVGRDGSKLIVQYIGKGPADYVGALCNVPVAFEAKSTGEDTRWRVPADRIHQWEFLQDVIAGNSFAFAGYLIEWRLYNRVVWYPFDGSRIFDYTAGHHLPDRQLWTAFRQHCRGIGFALPK